MFSLVGYTHAAPPPPPATSPATQPSQRHESFHRTISKQIGYDFLVQLPRDYDATTSKKYPLLIFLHGSGECGNDFDKLAHHSLLKLASQRDDFPFIVVAPQMPSYDWWSVESLNALLDHVLETYHVDRDRIYLTGLSLGGYGVWDWACHRPDAFAAIVPIAGEGNDDWAGKLKNVPIWAFHGEDDKAVSLAEAERMVNAVKKVGGDAKLTVYPKTGHNAWDQAYRDPALYEWLLSHQRHQ